MLRLKIIHISKKGLSNLLYRRLSGMRARGGYINLLWPLSERHWNGNISWWRHQMETFSRVIGHSCGEFTGPGEFPTQRPVTRSFEVFFDLRPNKRLSKQSWCWWFETQSCSLYDVIVMFRFRRQRQPWSLEEITSHTKWCTPMS